MKRSILFLLASIVVTLTFVGTLSESGPEELFGFTVSIWVYRGFWLFITVGFWSNYFLQKKKEKATE